jgi:hypothetical protein
LAQKGANTWSDDLALAQNRMKFYADNNRTFQQFHIRDLLYLKLQPFAQSSIAHKHYAKLSFKYFGPSRIIKDGLTAYKLLLFEKNCYSSVFSHVAIEVTHSGSYIATLAFFDIPPTLFSKDAPIVLECIIDHRLVCKGAATMTQVLIKWAGLPLEMSSWENFYFLKNRFPSSSIWGLVGFAEGAES